MRRSLLASLALLPLSLAAVAPSGELPEVYPTCASPQPIAPVQSFPASGNSPGIAIRPAIAWDGRQFGMAWGDNTTHLAFASFYADGTQRVFNYPVNALTVTYNSATHLDMIWDGTQFAIAVVGRLTGDTTDQVHLVRLTRDGALIGSPQRVSQPGVAAPTVSAANPAIATVGGYLVIAWNDARAGGTQDIYASTLTLAGTPVLTDLLVSAGPAAGDQVAPAIAPMSVFQQPYQMVLIAWQDGRSGTKQEIYDAVVSATGGIYYGPGVAVSPPTGNAITPALSPRPNGYGLAWVDGRDGNNEIYFAMLSDTGARVSSETRLTNDAAYSDEPRVLWTGGEFEVFWRDFRTAFNQAFWQRVADDGSAVGANVRLSALGPVSMPNPAFNGATFAVAADKHSGYLQMLYGIYGCGVDATPPACAGNYLAYNITGATASFSWTPAADPETGIAYYQVYRNNAPLAKTADPFFNDSGLSLSTTYNYLVQPVNAYQLQNGNCTASIYAKTNASLTLTVSKTAPDALLSWNDAGLNNYNVFRGTDPRVMSLVGATPALSQPDPNALGDAVSYFYTVDDPGI